MTASSVRYVAGLCPGCLNWQLEAPMGEDMGVIEGILRTHAEVCPWLEALATVESERKQAEDG